MKIFKKFILKMNMTPIPVNINLWWNFGSLLGVCLINQILSGLMLSFHYCPNTNLAFMSIIHMNHNINYGWIMHFIHMNMASVFFLCIYIHICRGIYYNSFKFTYTWMSGIILLFMLMSTAFLGYVLPWGQMSFWGATVITNLVSAIPYLGNNIVNWLWGGFSINNATLNRFFSLHFLLPIMMMLMMIMHIMTLHNTGSNSPLGINNNYYKVPFHNYFMTKDLMSAMMLMLMIINISIINPYLLSDPENFSSSNPLITPTHIQPEWYFLFAYAILRSIPNKLGGVVALLMSIIILITLPLFNNFTLSMKFMPKNKINFWIFFQSFIILTWMGSQPIEIPFIMISQMFTTIYFLFYLFNPIINYYWFKIMNIF